MQFILDQISKYLTPFTLSLYGACGETNYLLCSLLQKNFGFIDKNGNKKASYLYISNE